jgi:hypothetical protein
MEPSQDSRVFGPCPSDGDLICASSGELPPDEWPVVQRHLEHCADCRTRMRTIVQTLQICATSTEETDPAAELRVRAHRERLEDLMAAARADREVRSPRRWLAVAAALLAFVAGLALFRGDRVAYADEVVARAAQRELAFRMPTDRWRFRVIPSAGRQTSAARLHSSISQDATAAPAEVVELLQAHGFDPEHPLSLARLQAWRTSQPDRREQVTHRDGWLVVQSGTQRGALRHVELFIDEATFQVVKQTWSFAGIGQVVCERIRLVQAPERQPPPDVPPESGR